MKAESDLELKELDIDEQIEIWSIGMYAGDTPYDLWPALEANNPVISARQVSDIDALFVADPFMIQAGKTWHMFFEVLEAKTEKGEIGWATSENGYEWMYQRIVLREPFHLSYPYVFDLDGEYYMIPETTKARSIRLYRADPFPSRWSLVSTILDGPWADPSVFFFNGRWWMFACPASPKNDSLCLFYAAGIEGPWTAHSLNPIIEGNNQLARPGGRVIAMEDKVIRFSQNCFPHYGTQVRAFEITELTTSRYVEREVERIPVLAGGEHSWNRMGMHHVDPHSVDGRWLACVDGWRFEGLNPR